MFALAGESRHPGWPAKLGPLRVPAGQIALRPVRLRDATMWSRMRLRDEAYLREWEPEGPGSWSERYTPMAWPMQCAGFRRRVVASVASRSYPVPSFVESQKTPHSNTG